MHSTLHGQRIQNGYYFTNNISIADDIAALSTRATDLAVHFANNIYPKIKAFQNNQVQYNSFVVSTLIPHEGPIAESPVSVGSGDQPDESLPSYCAAIITLRTGVSGKSNRGRSYYSGVSENDHTAGELNPSAFTALEDIGNELLNRYGPAGSSSIYRYVVFSKKLGYQAGGIYSAAGIRRVIQYVPRRTLGTQRHRLIGKGT